jgi:hypothetical protein
LILTKLTKSVAIFNKDVFDPHKIALNEDDFYDGIAKRQIEYDPKGKADNLGLNMPKYNFLFLSIISHFYSILS